MFASMPMNGFVPTNDPEKARAFYEGVLGLELVNDNEYVATYRAGQNNIILQKNATAAPSARTIVGWEVKGIREDPDGNTLSVSEH